jgi:hypothetical protein
MRQHPDEPLPPDVLRLVEGIALTLAQEHHVAELRGKGLPNEADSGSDRGRTAASEVSKQAFAHRVG